MRITDPGVYDLPMATYRGQPTADSMSLSASDAICLSESTPMHLRQSWLEPEKYNAAANLGSIIHCLTLEPLRKQSAIKVIDADDFRTKAAQQARDDALATGLLPILPHTLDAANAAVDAIMNHQQASKLLEGGVAEQSYFAKHALGVWTKCRPDLVNGEQIIVDVKTCGSVHPEFIRRRIYDGGFYQQAPFHCMVYEAATGLVPTDYIWLCVEQKPPHAVAVYRPTRDCMVAGARKNALAIATFAECVRTGQWPGYPAGVTELGLPDYAHYRLEEEALAENEE